MESKLSVETTWAELQFWRKTGKLVGRAANAKVGCVGLDRAPAPVQDQAHVPPPAKDPEGRSSIFHSAHFLRVAVPLPAKCTWLLLSAETTKSFFNFCYFCIRVILSMHFVSWLHILGNKISHPSCRPVPFTGIGVPLVTVAQGTVSLHRLLLAVPPQGWWLSDWGALRTMNALENLPCRKKKAAPPAWLHKFKKGLTRVLSNLTDRIWIDDVIFSLLK